MTDLVVEAVASAQSCDAFCDAKGVKYGYVRGTAPFCGAGPGDCCDHDYPGPQASAFSDGGQACMTGTKQCCCGTKEGQSGCPKPGPSDLSCTIINGVCDIIAGKASTSAFDCAVLTTEGAAWCQAVGLGPEDPWADACSVAVGTTLEVACTQALKQVGKFAASECKKAAGCDISTTVSYNQTAQNSPIVA